MASIDDVLDAIVKDYKNVAVKAVKNAAKKAQNDVIKEAESYLQQYYANYEPKMYSRTNRLRRAILPYWADRSTSNGISIEVGVQYKSSALKGAYRSNSWWHQSGGDWISRFNDRGSFDFKAQDNGIPEPDWILENFLKGEHGGAQQDSESTNTLMKNFFDKELPNNIEKYIQEELFDVMVSRLKVGE